MESVRHIGGILLGYVAMAAFVFLSFSAFFLTVGPDVAFLPGKYDVSIVWIVVSFVLSAIAAVLGGVVCRKVAGCGKTVAVFAGVVFALGVMDAIPALTAVPTESTPREGAVSNMEAMMKARTPGWIALCNPFVGAIGALIGGKLAGGRRIRCAEHGREGKA